ncbi:MAG TPA: hypothetical protein VF472_08220 [Burkholderiaceae bacterium]
MSLSQAGAASNSFGPLASLAHNWRALDGYRQNAAADQGASPTNASDSAGTDQVSLSDASRALAALGGGTNGPGNAASASAYGSSDFGKEASYLGNIADASLVALGIITPDQQSGTQISFDSLSYQVSSSASAGISRQNGQMVAQYGSDQQAEFVGQGHITTADGRTFDFQIEVDLEQSQQAEATGNSSAPGNAPAPSSSDNAASPAASTAQASSDPINWDEILKQSKGLIDLLESIGKLDQANSAANPAVNPAAVAGTASNAGPGAATSTPGGAASSGNPQNQAASEAAPT